MRFEVDFQAEAFPECFTLLFKTAPGKNSHMQIEITGGKKLNLSHVVKIHQTKGIDAKGSFC